jgi:hypothetical protein
MRAHERFRPSAIATVPGFPRREAYAVITCGADSEKAATYICALAQSGRNLCTRIDDRLRYSLRLCDVGVYRTGTPGCGT